MIFFTGFPGFLCSELLPRVLARRAGSQAVCLVQAKFRDLAERRLGELADREPGIGGRVRLVEGDITRPGLGLDGERALVGAATEIFHLAAIYDLAVPRAAGVKVNVEGTRNVLDFAASCPHLARFQYISTCYVSGRYPGIFRESDLDKGQEFNNHYEETKFLAEVEVQARMKQGFPATVYRPAIVVGDSRSGATQKYDGPYYAIRWLVRQPGVAFMPVVGDTSRSRLNLVPRDFVIAALDHLAALPAARGQVYQLADPEPLTIAEVLEAIAKATGRRIVRLPLPLGVAKAAIDKVPGVYRLMKIPSATVDYFVHPTFYDTANAQRDLGPAGIRVPPLRTYLPALIGFMKEHPEIRSEAMA